jgi:hypothetical protein
MLALLVLTVLAPVIVLLVWVQRSQERTYNDHRVYLYGLIASMTDQAKVRESRIRELEDALYAKHAAVLELPNLNREPPAPDVAPLPAEVQAFVDGFAEPEARDEFTEEARRLMATTTLTPRGVVATLTGSGATNA